MNNVQSVLLVLVFSLSTILEMTVHGHGMLMDPVGRSSRWRFNKTAPANYDDNGLFCGGFWKQWNTNKGNCGLCGDDFSIEKPRPNEIGGRYGEGVIVKSYQSGENLNAGVKITANHRGYFRFDLCNMDVYHENDICYSKYPLLLVDGNDRFYVRTDATGMYNVLLQLPSYLSCNHCILRWTYTAGNNWGMCPNGTGAVGCGPQETFRSCSDISITPHKNTVVLTTSTLRPYHNHRKYYIPQTSQNGRRPRKNVVIIIYTEYVYE